MLMLSVSVQGASGSLEVSTSPDDDDDVDDLLMLSDVDGSLRSLSLKHHLAVKSVGFFYMSFDIFSCEFYQKSTLSEIN